MSEMSTTQDIILNLTARQLHSFVIGPDLKLLISDTAKVKLISTLPLLGLVLEAVEEEVTIALEMIIGTSHSAMTVVTSSDKEQYDKELVLGYTARRLKNFIRSPSLAQIVARVRNIDQSGDLLSTVAKAVMGELSDEIHLIVNKEKNGVTQMQASPKEDIEPKFSSQLLETPLAVETQQLLCENVTTFDESITNKQSTPDNIADLVNAEVTTTNTQRTSLVAAPTSCVPEIDKSFVSTCKSSAPFKPTVYKKVIFELDGLAASLWAPEPVHGKVILELDGLPVSIWAPEPGQTDLDIELSETLGDRPLSHGHMSQWRRTKP